MSDDAAPSLALIARQQKQIISDLATMRDDMTVLTAIVMRMDSNQAAFLTERRAIHSQQSRMNNRVRELERAAAERDA